MGHFVLDFLHASILVFGLLVLGFLVFIGIPVAIYTLLEIMGMNGK